MAKGKGKGKGVKVGANKRGRACGTKLQRWEIEREKILAGIPSREQPSYTRRIGEAYAAMLGQEARPGVLWADVVAYGLVQRAAKGDARAAAELRQGLRDAVDADDWRERISALGVTDVDEWLNRMADGVLDQMRKEGEPK